MKRLFISLSSLLLCLGLSAQMTDVEQRIHQNPELGAGCNSTYRFDVPALTKAPKGYDVVYITHYSRHGSRYAWEDLYTRVDTLLRKASDAGMLTAYGEQFLAKTDSLVVITKHHIGELCEKGWSQQNNIGRTMAASFPKFFKQGPEVRAVSSHSQRCLMSMAAFCLGLEAAAPKAEIYEEVGENWYWEVIPNDAQNPFRKKYVREKHPFDISPYKLIEGKVNYDDMVGRLLKDPSKLGEFGAKSKESFIYDLYEMLAGMYSIDNPVGYDNFFTVDEWAALWEGRNFSSYNYNFRPYWVYPVVESIVSRAEAALESGRPAVDLRFGHDTVLIPLSLLLSINGCGDAVQKPEDVKYQFQDFKICMAGNIQFILYRNRKDPSDVLFKLLQDGVEATLPLKAVEGPYYRWSDFVEYAGTLKKELDGSDPAPRGHAPSSTAGLVPTWN